MNDDINIPVKQEIFNKKKIKKLFKKYNIINLIKIKDNNDNLDKLINDNNKIIDLRIQDIQIEKYSKETYELFKLELGYFLKKNLSINDLFLKLYQEKNKNKLKQLLYKITIPELYDIYIKNKLYDDISNKLTKNELVLFDNNNTFIYEIEKIPNIDDYEIDNYRNLCHNKINKYHCYNSKLVNKLILTKKLTTYIIGKIISHLLSNEILIKELLNLNEYYIQDIVDKNVFTQRKNQIIITNQNINIKKILENIFGKNNIPIIGKRRFFIINEDIQNQIDQNPIYKYGNIYHQKIYDKYLIYRAYVNALYWLKTKTENIDIKNLGYYSNLQNDIIFVILGNIVKWCNLKNNIIKIINVIQVLNYNKSTLYDYIVNLNESNNQYYIIALYILYSLYKIPIIIYNKNNIPIIFINNYLLHLINEKNNEKINEKNNEIQNLIDNNEIKNYINIKFNTETYDQLPSIVTVIYYIN